MHPPSPPLSPSVQATAENGRDNPIIPLSPGLSKILLPSAQSSDDAASKASQDTISTRRSHRTLPGLNIEAANNCVSSQEEGQERRGEQQAVFVSDKGASVDKRLPPLHDVGYVEAMRLWYEEKENEAQEAGIGENKASRRAGRFGRALASVNANQRL